MKSNKSRFTLADDDRHIASPLFTSPPCVYIDGHSLFNQFPPDTPAYTAEDGGGLSPLECTLALRTTSQHIPSPIYTGQLNAASHLLFIVTVLSGEEKTVSTATFLCFSQSVEENVLLHGSKS